MTYILYNPKANNGHGTDGLDKVTAAVKAAGGAPELRDLTQLDAGAFLMGLAAGDQAILCGGDGTLHRLVNSLDGRVPAAPVYVWRMGTGNDFLRDVSGKNGPRAVLLNDYIKDLPRAEVKGRTHRFLNNVSFGIDGQVCELGELEKERLGRKVGYIPLTIRLALKMFQPVNATVTVDGETRSYRRVWVASAFNGRYVGGGVKLAPGQDRMSDKLCCVVLHDLGRVWVLVNLARAMWGGHTKLPQCDVRFGHEIAVTFDAPTALNMDGEVISGVTEYRAVK